VCVSVCVRCSSSGTHHLKQIYPFFVRFESKLGSVNSLRCLVRLFGWLVVWLVGWLVVWLFGCLVVWLFGCLVVWLFGCLVVWLFGCFGLLIWGMCL